MEKVEAALRHTTEPDVPAENGTKDNPPQGRNEQEK